MAQVRVSRSAKQWRLLLQPRPWGTQDFQASLGARLLSSSTSPSNQETPRQNSSSSQAHSNGPSAVAFAAGFGLASAAGFVLHQDYRRRQLDRQLAELNTLSADLQALRQSLAPVQTTAPVEKKPSPPTPPLGQIAPPRALPPEFLEAVVGALGEDRERVVTDEEELQLHAKPWNSYHPVINLPQAVIFPRVLGEVVGVVQACEKWGIPITAFGGGTSTEGHITTPVGGVTLNLKFMNRVVEIHPEDLDVVVEPGVEWIELNKVLAPLGLFFPLDPGPGATIGGMCATRCSGSLAVRYGTMRDNVISLEVVMPDGQVVRTSSRARKSAAGYDLTRLMIGSEGTLGIITQITLRLQNIPKFSAVAMCSFPSVRDAAKAATDTIKEGVQVSRVELLDDVMMSAINKANGYSYSERPTLMYELVGSSPESVQEQVGMVEGVVVKNGGSNFVFADTEEEKKELWRARKEALWAGYTLRPGTEPLITDVCVPLSRLADIIAATKEDLKQSSLPCPLLAHAGDGNMHVCIFFDTDKPEEVEEAQDLASKMTLRALEMGGTCTGEHGVGVGKVQYLERELGTGAMRTMKQVKDALDPKGIMNPGKVLPPHICS